MKKALFTILTLCVILAACKNNHRRKYHGANNSDSTESVGILRDTSINPQNAYNNMFVDSSALNNYITENNVNADVADAMQDFYNARNFEFAWFDINTITEQGREFWNLCNYTVSSLKDSSFFNPALNKKMPDITSADSISVKATDTGYINTELMLTQAFMQLMIQKSLPDSDIYVQQYTPAKKDEVMHAASVILSTGEDDVQNEDAAKAFSSLKKQLRLYYDVEKKGGWQSINYIKKKLKKGAKGPEVLLCKQRLQATGELDVSDTTPVFDELLDTAVKSFEIARGFKPDGVIGDSLIKEMNVPAKEIVEKLIINLNRVRWMPKSYEGRYITVNIPEYQLHVFDSGQKAFDMNVVVGKGGSGTVIFTGNLTEIVFSPYWNLPFSIIKKEVLPKMEENKNYLEEENMEITGHSNGLPIIRQKPGPKNALGRVKFIFHNSYNIYFHDTPEKSLFERDRRAYSHGCIRLSDPVKMANYLLDNRPIWTAGKIDSAMNAGKERYVDITHPVPVIISYYTTWVDDEGRLNVRPDIYKHDADMAQKMFTNP